MTSKVCLCELLLQHQHLKIKLLHIKMKLIIQLVLLLVGRRLVISPRGTITAGVRTRRVLLMPLLL